MRRSTMAVAAAVLMAGALSMATPAARAAAPNFSAGDLVLGCTTYEVQIYRSCRGWVCVGEFRSRCEAYEVAREYECRGYEARVLRSF